MFFLLCFEIKKEAQERLPIEKIAVEVAESEPWFLDLVDSVWNLGVSFLLTRIRSRSSFWVRVDPSQ